MRFDANLSWLFTELPFAQRFDAAAAAGFTGVEYGVPYPHTPAQLRTWLADAGLTQVLINTPSTCLDKDFRAGVDQGLEYAAELGSLFLHLVGGIAPDGVSRDRAFAQYVANVGWAVERARGSGVRLLLEVQSYPGFVVDSHRQAADVVDAIGADHLGLLVDIFHARIMEDNLVATLTELLGSTFHLQIADPPGRGEPGTGEIEWQGVFDALTRGGYDGWIGCEYKPVADTVTGLRWIQELAP
nr:TIM barrel protein [Kibdelosporangium sp. MJ126-NF4]CEL17333.1 Hydroxypyruvate isomerase [Kibdelosporangium sp. MJ126-NF4]CTQ91439.1 Hydroxypyruvate isomerase (EC 5.3.1.22) [Kibdelosporangium sp. MJ126-NF4]